MLSSSKNEKKRKNVAQKTKKTTENEPKYTCEYCNYETLKKGNYGRHMRSKTHLLRTENSDIQKYACYECGYFTNKLTDYNRHLKTKKHTNKVGPVELFECEYCKKTYKTRSGLYKHYQKCIHNNQIDICGNTTNNIVISKETDITDLTDLKNLVLDIAKSNEVIKNLVKDPKIQINNVTNIENYLNIECKDAINMSDFIRQLQITLSDILYLGDKGFSKSVERLLVSSLQDMEQTKRPIHCINKKKKTLYIKDNNVWEKDKEHKKMKQVIDTIHRKELNDTLTIMDKHNEYFEDYENLQTKNNIIISLTGADKDNTLKTITKSISNTTFLQ
jgi:hypothetical protein